MQVSHASHPFYLVRPSRWPICIAFSILAFVFGGAMALHKMPLGLPVVALGALAIVTTLFFWWRDVLIEGKLDHSFATPQVRHGARFGMLLFIASEVMFFSAFFWAYFGAAFDPRAPLTDVWAIAKGVWPPAGITAFDPFDIPFMNTLVLLLSGTTVTWAHAALLEGNRRDTIRGLALTVVLGMSFTCLQAYEYAHAAFKLTDGKYASTFFLATGFHGLHVIIGTIFLAVMLRRAITGTLTEENHLGFEFAAWYWHFVDVVWLFLFVGVYWYTSS
ncbi:MAG: cytochrome c oxidase subunit 3 [Alphaproteobacteria bacterium]